MILFFLRSGTDEEYSTKDFLLQSLSEMEDAAIASKADIDAKSGRKREKVLVVIVYSFHFTSIEESSISVEN